MLENTIFTEFLLNESILRIFVDELYKNLNKFKNKQQKVSKIYYNEGVMYKFGI
jgi:hypothetical protein